MHGEPSIRDDSTLLARWAREGNEEAFAEIVRHYQRLVLGVALRGCVKSPSSSDFSTCTICRNELESLGCRTKNRIRVM